MSLLIAHPVWVERIGPTAPTSHPTSFQAIENMMKHILSLASPGQRRFSCKTKGGLEKKVWEPLSYRKGDAQTTVTSHSSPTFDRKNR